MAKRKAKPAAAKNAGPKKPARKAMSQDMPHPAADNKAAKWIVATQAEVADFFGVTFDTVKTWARNSMPRGAKRYDLAEITRWLLERRGRQTMATPEASDRRALLELRKLQADVDKVERANAEAHGLLIDRRAVEAQVGQLLIELRKSFERIPTRIQPAVPRDLESTLLPELRRLVNHTLHEVAQRMADFTPPAPAETGQGDGVSAAADRGNSKQ